MNPNEVNRLFEKAFADEASKQATSSGPLSPNQRSQLFEDAFRDRDDMPKPNFSGWALSTKGANSLNFSEKMQLQQYWDARVRYSELPQWIRESGAVIPSKEERRVQEKLTTESGLDLNQRQQAFSVMTADIEALAEMATRGTLQDSTVLDQEYLLATKKYGVEIVNQSLAEINPEAATYFHKRSKVQFAEASERQSQAQIRKDIQDAQQKIALLNAERGEAATDELLRQMDVRRNLENAERSE
jgi:hypothetical protein